MAIRTLVVIRGSVTVTTMSIAAIRLNLDRMGVDDVLDLLVTGRFVVVATVNVVVFALGVVTVTALVLAVVGVVVIVLHLPIKFVMGGMLQLNEFVSYFSSYIFFDRIIILTFK